MGNPTRLALGLATGLLLSLAYPPVDFWVVAWVAFLPLLWAVRDVAPREACSIGFLSGLAFYLLVGSWFLRLWQYNPFVPLAYILLAALFTIPWGLFAMIVTRTNRSFLGPLLIGAAWVSTEYLRSLMSLGLSWPLLGASQHRFLPSLQTTSLVGQYGPSFLVALGNGAVNAIVHRRWIMASSSLAIILSTVLWGTITMAQVEGNLPVAAVFTSFSPQEKWSPAYLGRIVSDLTAITWGAGRDGARLVVWPETALPVDLLGPSGLVSEIGALARRAKSGLLATSLQEGKYNMVVSFGSDGKILGRYNKVIPVPFVETHLRPGARIAPLPSAIGPVGTVVCWESMFPWVFQTHVKQGATLLAVVTNDAYLGSGPGAEHHAIATILRAIETRRYLILAANGSPSMIVDPYGRITARTGLGKVGYAFARIEPRTGITPAVRLGNTFPLVCLAATVLGAVLTFRGAPLTGLEAGHTMNSTSLRRL